MSVCIPASSVRGSIINGTKGGWVKTVLTFLKKGCAHRYLSHAYSAKNDLVLIRIATLYGVWEELWPTRLVGLGLHAAYKKH